MGNSNTFENLEVTNPSQPGEWIIENQLSYCTLVRNTKTNCLAEQYQLLKNPKSSDIKNLETYQYRRRQNENIVKVYKAQEQPSSYLCHGRDYLKVKTQRIPFRLSQLGPLNLSEGLFILLNSLKGYKTIFDLNGASIIDDEMIGFTEEGKVKVWLSSNFAKNTPDSQIVFKPEDYLNNQKNMVAQVVEIVKDHLIIKQYPSNLFNLQQTGSTFLQGIQAIERYISVYRLSLPISITFRQQQKETSLSNIQSQINRGNSTIIQTKQNSTIRQPLITCGGIFQTSTNNIAVPLTSSQISNKTTSQISNQSQKIQINNGNQTSRSSIHKQYVKTNSVLKQSTQLNQNPLGINYTPLTFRQLTNNLSQNPPIIPNVIHVNNVQTTSFQSPMKTFQHQNFKSIQKPTTLYYSRSVDNLQSPRQNNPYIIDKNNVQLISSKSNVIQQKTSSQLIGTTQSRTRNAWHSPGAKIGDYGSRNQISVIDSLGVGSKGRIQNIINQNIRYTSPSKIFYQNQISSTISETQPQKQNFFNNPKYTYLPKYNSLMTENTKQKQSSRIVFNSPPKNINIYQSNDYLKKNEVKKSQISTQKSPSLTESAYKSYMQKVQSCVSSLKTNLFELKQLEVKNYLIGNSQISPMKSIDDQNYVNPFLSNLKQSNSFVNNNNSQLKSNSNNSQIKTQLSQLQKQSVGVEQDVFDPNIFKQSKLSEISHPSLVKDLTPISYISASKISEEKIGESSNSQPIQIQYQQQQIDQDEIKLMISKNLKFVQRIALSYVDQIEQKELSRTQLMVPSYSQFRQTLLASNSLPSYQYKFQTMQ